MSVPTFRQASLDDLGDIDTIMVRAFDPAFGEAWTQSQCAACFALPGYRWMLAELDGRTIGFLLSRAVADESEMMLLAVLPNDRGRRIGGGLIEDWLENCRTQNIVKVHLEVRENNDAVKLYSDFGFTICALRPDYYTGADGARFSALTMARPVE